MTHLRSRPNLYLPEDDQDIWPKHVAVVRNKYKNFVQLFGSEIYVY